MRKPPLDIDDILDWGDAFLERHGRFPMGRGDGDVLEAFDTTWCGIDQALKKGHRGLPGGSTLAILLLEERDRRHKGLLPPFTIKQMLAWADAHHKRTHEWPTLLDGAIAEAPGETWLAVDHALRTGMRGQPGGSSLAQLLADKRNVRNHLALPLFSQKELLAWIDAHHERTGNWPTRNSGAISEAPGETWKIVNEALIQGLRGLAGGSSLARFLSKHRGVRNRKRLPRLSVRKILIWADAHRERTGRWPTHISGPIPEAPGETWGSIHASLYRGSRGFPGGSSLFQLLQQHGRRRFRIQARARLS